MPERPVLLLGNPLLKEVAKPVGDDQATAATLAADLLHTMDVSPGCVGLAAPQIGIPRRAFCLDVSPHGSQRKEGARNHGRFVLTDPELVHTEGSHVAREGCMSVPDWTANVRRAMRVVVRGRDEHGRERVYDATGFEARALQHELDHLDGLLILDRVSSLSTDVFRRRTYQHRRD